MALTIYAWRHVIDTVIFLGCSEKEDLDEVAAAKIENSTAAELQLAAGTDPHPCDQAVDPVKRIIDGFNDFKINKFEYDIRCAMPFLISSETKLCLVPFVQNH